MRIGVLSQNMAETRVQPSIDDATVIGLTPDIYVEMTQEDGRVPDGTPVLHADRLARQYQLLNHVSLNGKQRTRQNVAMSLYVRTSTHTFRIVDSGSQAIAPKGSSLRLFAQSVAKTLHTGLGYSKGMVYMKITADQQPILFVNMHLPMKAKMVDGRLKDPTLGLEFRRESFFTLLRRLESLGLLRDRPLLFVGGDLNFRMDLSGEDQLTRILRDDSRLLYGLQELPTPQGDKGITCKFTRRNAQCRSRKLPNRQSEIHDFLESVQSDCGDPARTPSRCDRFLVSVPMQLQVQVLLNTSRYLLPDSDHNAVMSCIEFSPAQRATRGGRTNKTRRARK